MGACAQTHCPPHKRVLAPPTILSICFSHQPPTHTTTCQQRGASRSRNNGTAAESLNCVPTTAWRDTSRRHSRCVAIVKQSGCAVAASPFIAFGCRYIEFRHIRRPSFPSRKPVFPRLTLLPCWCNRQHPPALRIEEYHVP